MEAKSSGLEISVLIDKQEIEKLKKQRINGRLDFYDFLHGKRKQIPISIEIREEQKELVRVNQHPVKVYFGDAKKIVFGISREFYKIFLENKKAGTRYGIGGKFELQENEDRFINAENY